MGRKYNKKYKKGKFTKSRIAWKADLAKLPKNQKHVLRNDSFGRKVWKTDTRKFDLIGVDTPDWFNKHFSLKQNKPFNYTHRSKKKLGVKKNRENKHYRRYWGGK